MISRRLAVVAWLCALAAAAAIVARLGIDTDMSAFLPRDPSPAQRVLVDQLRDGVVSRLVLVAVVGVPPPKAAAINRGLAARLRADPDFVTVENGDESGFARDREFLWSNRYLLTDPGDYSASGLQTALRRDLAALGSSAGFLVKQTLAADPTGAMLRLLARQMGEGGGPARNEGVWASADGTRSLLLVRLHAAGSDLDGAERALSAIRTGFAAEAGGTAAALIVSGPPVFAVEARARIKSDATRLSALASLLVAGALLTAYRSPRVLALAFVPVVSGALVGVAAVGVVFRNVHGITLGFGATLIGEAVDYAVYLFSQTAPGDSPEATLKRISPTLGLGVLTSICGFSAMLLSRFDGFAQLGVFTIAGLATAASVTRWVLPALIPASFAGVREPPIPGAILRLPRLRAAIPPLALLAAVSLALGQGTFWAGDLSSLSPVPPDMQRLDQSLRQDMRAPDAAYLVVVKRHGSDAALEAAELLTARLEPVIRQGGLAGLDSPATYLPSLATQRARQAALPDAAKLAESLDAALDGMPFQPNLFAPFQAAIADARAKPPITRASLDGTSLSLRLDSLLLHQGEDWTATLSLRGVTSRSAVALAIADVPGADLINLKAESDGLLRVYLREGVSLAVLGAVAICVLLLVSLRSFARLAAIVAPLAVAVLVTLAVLRLGGHALSIFNLFGLLLVVAIGSNYCLFLDRQRADPAGLPRVLASLVLANFCTVAGFGVLATSQTPLLHDLGLPVAIGTFLSLIFAMIMLSPRASAPNAA